jgi:hypothetical protein
VANEATVTAGLQIAKGNLSYVSRPNQFRADVDGIGGPTPGQINVPVTGIDVDLSVLSTPGLCRIINLDSTNYVFGGIYDGASFFPLFEVLPGECYVFRLYRHLGDEFVGTGTPADVNTLRIMADTAECKVSVEAFEK